MSSLSGWVWAVCLALLGTMGIGGSVAAQDGEQSAEAEARQAFVEGREHYDDERFRLAVESFRRAYQLLHEAGSPMAPTILYNVATALDELPGHQQEARDTYRRFLDEAPADGDPELRHIVEMRIRELDLSIAEQSDTPAETTEDTQPEPAEEPSEESMSIVGPIVAAGGGALLVTGAILGAIALGQGNDIEDACPDLTGCAPELRSDYDQMRTRSVTADVLIFGGLTIAAVGAVLMFTLKSGGQDDVSVGAACDGQGCYASARGTF